ncbi:MAG: thioredoxin family protein [Cruoricaptor ignavus]|nr:thioredoxin family protein [Cruoricaptor ignavus]
MKIVKTIISATFLFALLQSCQAQKVVVNREVETQTDGKMLLGRQTADQFLQEPYSDWYNQEYNDYQIDEQALRDLKKIKFNSHLLTVFVGTWCGDSHREFPRLMKILDELKFPKEKITIIGVNRKKESPAGEEGLYNIQKVPTIIVKKYGKELGRIIEFPKSGYIEKDLVEIARKRDTSISDLIKK